MQWPHNQVSQVAWVYEAIVCMQLNMGPCMGIILYRLVKTGTVVACYSRYQYYISGTTVIVCIPLKAKQCVNQSHHMLGMGIPYLQYCSVHGLYMRKALLLVQLTCAICTTVWSYFPILPALYLGTSVPRQK